MIERTQFGTMPDGQIVESFIMTNKNGISVEILTLGAIIRSWTINDENQTDIVLGFDTVEDYLADQGYIGRTVGRYANRIEKGQFSLGGVPFQVNTNLQGHCLHGGKDGFHNRLWRVTHIDDDEQQMSLRLRIISQDGDQGFPGTLRVDVTFALDQDNGLTITYEAESDADTVFNPTQHSYFNLAGHDSGEVFEQSLQVVSRHYTPANSQGIPTGEIREVEGTAFDLNDASKLEELIHHTDPQITAANGLDHNWCIENFDPKQQTLQLAAIASDAKHGRKLLVHTTMPGVQVYTGNFVGDKPKGKGDVTYGPYHAFCVESQFYPNSPNESAFPSPELKAGETFISKTRYQIL
ncbi:aldose epimerase family protein [Aliiglaciecola sp. M165]|uniref:aldose epimerase family protein n=1 Tax=Aliiglaciecola sp. M165 TaxID=2593649 RepID=UPI001180831B|nr:aldose epimerase family protein [Aliiglaciecola sp. M165]TRY31940.1 galactose mutarotase [Aliiglaciecola sp. M165]